MARRNRPHDPAKAQRERIERDAEIARLKAQGAEVSLDRGGKLVSARRSNVFTLLLKRGSITPNQHDAAYRLSLDWAAWKGLDGKPESFGEVVDGGSGSVELVTDRMIRAGRTVRASLRELHDRDSALLEAFMVATVEEDRAMAWRGVVERVLGPMGRDRQVSVVVDALEALRAVYEGPRRVAA
jgi:hypothetical protein